MRTPLKDFIEAEVEGVGTIVRVAKHCGEVARMFKEGGARHILARDLAVARMEVGYDSSLCSKGSYVKEDVLYTPDKTILTRGMLYIPSVKRAKQATEDHRKRNEASVQEKIVERVFRQVEKENKEGRAPEDRKTLVINKRGYYEIPLTDFQASAEARFLFGKDAEKYAVFLDIAFDRKGLSKVMPIYLTGNSKETFGNQLWLGGLDGGSCLNGNGRDLDCCDGFRGVLNDAEGGVPKNSNQKLPYTPRELGRIEKILEGVKNGSLPASKLEKALSFVEKLRE